MAIQYPENRKEVIDRIKTDIQNELPEAEPFLRNSTLSADATGYGGAAYDIYLIIKKAQDELMPDTATGDFLKRWGGMKGIQPNSASQSYGYVTATGDVSSVIGNDATLQYANGNVYKLNNDYTIETHIVSIQILTRDGTTAHATSASSHNFASGNTVLIAGAIQSEYNGSKQIIVTSETTFDFEVSGSPIVPATGTITASLDCANLYVTSVNFGAATNLYGGSKLTFTSSIAGIDNTAIVQYSGLTGGYDIENDPSYRERILDAYGNPVSYFNVPELTALTKSVSGITRCWIKEITPEVGDVTIYFVLDNAANIIPTPQDIDNVKNKILTIKPAHVNPDFIYVLAPTPIVVDFVFSTIDPNTATMRQAITENLRQFFIDYPQVGESIPEVAYTSTIYQTIDPATGKFIKSFTLTSPSSDIIVTSGQLAVLGSVS